MDLSKERALNSFPLAPYGCCLYEERQKYSSRKACDKPPGSLEWASFPKEASVAVIELVIEVNIKKLIGDGLKQEYIHSSVLKTLAKTKFPSGYQFP